MILQSHLAAHGGRVFSAYLSVNCLLHISINYMENVTDLYAHVQTVDTRRSSQIFQAPGYKAKIARNLVHVVATYGRRALTTKTFAWRSLLSCDHRQAGI